ncbi:hypothetical protein [Methylobacterium organophilum]|uniref:Uncharacterized protein n=1 Tax=Methylobacterium organophilum TaxID=410 RepID=A0ABQ4TH20_METOR|nr:hypothetical protein [Methylobacterium organophilum]GJE29751.1 hypothetical protein LKMONMHP_4637 [Methylobacterium organophilum]
MRILRVDGVIAGPGNTLVPMMGAQTPQATFDIIAFARTVLGKGTPELLAVMTWARIVSANGHADSSIAEWCKLYGWKERTFHRRRRRGIAKITAAKNTVG